MKFLVTIAVSLTLGGFLNAQQTKLLGEDDPKTAVEISTKIIIIMPTPEAETPAEAARQQGSEAAGQPDSQTAPAVQLSSVPAAQQSATPASQPEEKKSGIPPPARAAYAPPGLGESLQAAGLTQSPQGADAGGFVVDKKHAVTRGDTLWDLSRKYYRDPFKWGKIYNANTATVKNPDRIYPADELVIPDITEKVKPEPAPSRQSLEEPDTITDIARAGEALPAVPPPPVAGEAKAAAPGLEKRDEFLDFVSTDLSEEMPQDMREWRTDVKIAPDNWTEAGVITAKESSDGGDYGLAFSGEIVLVRVASPAAFKPGNLVTSYLKGASVFDKTGKYLGREIQKTGMLEVISVDGDMVKARVLDASTSINKGQVVKK